MPALLMVVATALLIALGSLGILGFFLLISLWHVWWLYPAWEWFLVPLGLPPITVWHFWGLWLVIRHKGAQFETERPKETRGPTTQEVWGTLIGALIGPILLWTVLRWLAGV